MRDCDFAEHTPPSEEEGAGSQFVGVVGLRGFSSKLETDSVLQSRDEWRGFQYMARTIWCSAIVSLDCVQSCTIFMQ